MKIRQISILTPGLAVPNRDLDLVLRIEQLKSELSNKGFNTDKAAKDILYIIEDKITLVEKGLCYSGLTGTEERPDQALNTLLLMLKTLCSTNKPQAVIPPVLGFAGKCLGSAEQAGKGLVMQSTAQNSILLNFILEALKIPYELNAINSENVLIPEKKRTMDWKNLPKLPLNQGGTYLFTQKLDLSTYIGSAFSFEERMLQHKRQFTGALKIDQKSARALHKLEHLRQETLTLDLIHIIPNYFKLFKLDYPEYVLSKGEYEILLNLTFYPVRVLEQNLINTFKPNINGYYGKYYTKVIHKFNSWDPLTFNLPKRKLDFQKEVFIYNLKGDLIYNALSYKEAALFLGRKGALRGAGLSFYMDNALPLFSTNLNKEVLLRSEKSSTTNLMEKRKTYLVPFKDAKPLNLSFIKLEELSLNFIYCFEAEGLAEKGSIAKFFTG